MIEKNNLVMWLMSETNCFMVGAKEKNQEITEIATISWDKSMNDASIKTIKDNFQTYIVLYETFADFIYLVDIAYDELRAIYFGGN